MAARETIVLTLLAVLGASALQPSIAVPESPALAELAGAVAAGNVASVERFWERVREQNSPLVEPIPGDAAHVRATFLWKGDAAVNDVVLIAKPDGISAYRDPRSHLVHLDKTDIWYRTHTLPRDAEFSYMFSVDPPAERAGPSSIASLRSDPFNPLQYRVLTGPIRSIARMPDVAPNPWIADQGNPSGTVTARAIASTRLGGERQLWVYTTAGELRDPSLLILLDGQTYVQSLPAPRILDNLYAEHRIGSTVAIFVKDGPGDAWKTDMYFSDSFVDFLATELVPWARREYHVVADGSRTVIGGDSIAGLTAAFAAFRRPAVFGRVIAQSASFWLNNHALDDGEPEWLSRQILAAPASRVSFWLDVGRMEFVANEADRTFPPFVPGTTSLLAANRHLRDCLRVRGYTVEYVETDGDHEPLRWQRTLPQALMYALGRDEPARVGSLRVRRRSDSSRP